MTPLERVRAELARYEHLLVDFAALETAAGEVELRISLKLPPEGAHVYAAPVHRRDIASPQFEWHFQRMLYDYLHDYLVELFVRNPQQLGTRQP